MKLGSAGVSAGKVAFSVGVIVIVCWEIEQLRARSVSFLSRACSSGPSDSLSSKALSVLIKPSCAGVVGGWDGEATFAVVSPGPSLDGVFGREAGGEGKVVSKASG